MDTPYTHYCANCGAQHTYRTVVYMAACCGAVNGWARRIGEKVSVLTETAVIDPPPADLGALL